ncbi:hypothetical protein BDV93DRAFT_543513 [Ceratobasidium sp. AG-I]|nr:hypothetical protein BDV93DRAFT_543513 [Ceratobasidium sp. AG-I]
MSRPLHTVASGILFIAHTFTVPSLPNSNNLNQAQHATRASAVRRERGGASATVLSVPAQFTHAQAYLVAPVGSGPEGKAMVKELESVGAQEYTPPRPFLLAMARLAAPHALLCAEWGRAGNQHLEGDAGLGGDGRRIYPTNRVDSTHILLSQKTCKEVYGLRGTVHVTSAHHC